MSKYLITGGAGFIGGNFCHYMTERYPENEYFCLDALTYAGNLETLYPVLQKKNFHFIHANICDEKLIPEIFEKERFDYAINFAAESHVDRSIENPNIFLNTNVLGTLNLLNACLKFKVKRFHQVSTDEVYGDLPLDRPDLFFTEDSPIKTSSPYSASKASADLMTLAYHRTFGLPVTISRCSNNYGPYHFPEKLIPLVIQKAISGEKIPVYGNGANIRDWLHVYDHCTAIDLILQKGKDGEVYNIGGHNERSNLEVVKRILNELGKSESLIEFVKDRPGHDLRYAMDPTKIMRELDWKPKYTFETGIRPTIDWNLNHQEWLEHVKSGEYLRFMKKHYE